DGGHPDHLRRRRARQPFGSGHLRCPGAGVGGRALSLTREGIAGPAARGGKVELAVGFLALLGHEQLETGALPQTIGGPWCLGGGNVQAGEFGCRPLKLVAQQQARARLGAGHGQGHLDR
ncbi:hypothetical protein RZS08_24710, partial [Arthrospira platensis SPKY1]|nr:hypothetical protein [Arthrospira platensis SPKY1]